MNSTNIPSLQKQKMSFFNQAMLQMTKEQILEEFDKRFAFCERELLFKRYDMKDLMIYPHQQYDNQAFGQPRIKGINGHKPSENRNLSNWIGKVGGRMRLSVDENVDIVIVEDFKLRHIVDDFLKWRQKSFDIIFGDEDFESFNLFNLGGSSKLDVKMLGKTKREQMLLGGIGNLQNNTLQQQIDQRSLSINDKVERISPKEGSKQLTLDQMFSSKLKMQPISLDRKNEPKNYLEELWYLLKREPDEKQRDYELISCLIKKKSMMIIDIEIIFKAIHKFYFFTFDFQRRKKIPIIESQLKNAFCLTSRNRLESLAKPSMYQMFHVFETKSYLIHNHHGLYEEQTRPLFPKFHKEAPYGSSVFLDFSEYINIMKDKEQKEVAYWKHVEKLEQKKPEFYDIKTPIPAHTDRCFVCDDKIQVDYKQHLKSEAHLENIKKNPIYNMIDDLIDELKFEQDLKKEKQNKRRRRKRTVKNQDQIFSEEDEEEEKFVNPLNQSQEFTNLNLFSTEVTLAKTAHRKKQRFPQPMYNLEQQRIHQVREMQQSQSFKLQNMKRKRVQIIEEEKEIEEPQEARIQIDQEEERPIFVASRKAIGSLQSTKTRRNKLLNN